MKIKNSFISFYLVLIATVFTYSLPAWACEIAVSTPFKACEKSKLVSWNDWSRKNPFLAGTLIPPKKRAEKAMVLIYEANSLLDFPVSSLNLEKNINLDTVKKFESDSRHVVLKRPNISNNETDTSLFLKEEAYLGLQTTAEQPKKVQDLIDFAIGLMISLNYAEPDQKKILIYDNYYYYIKKSEVSNWLPLISELDSGLAKNPSTEILPTEILLQYLDNFSLLGLKGIVLTMFYPVKNQTQVNHYVIVSLKGEIISKQGVSSFLMGENNDFSKALRYTYFQGSTEGIIGGLPNYFRNKVKLANKGLQFLNKK
ncbi:MAG: hypothetical protein H6625_02395 [Bdellovibrionaceae bacterium]|nr:hypothetical protein [Pseudobdellovibrionaceae bacterium]